MAIISLIFFALMFLGLPVAFAIGIAGFWFFLSSPIMPTEIGVQKIATMSQSFPLLAVPFFVFAGHLMNESGITGRLFRFSQLAVGWMSGGLGQIAILLATLMGGVSGSAVADAAMEARVLGPQMIQRGYGKGFSASVIAVGSLITATIPPSIGLILYGYVGNVSIGRLFLAGVVPGIVMMAGMMLTTYVIAKRRGYVVADTERPRARALASAAWGARWALIFPVALLVAIRGGVFTPSEVGAFAVVYAILVGFLLHREMTLETLMEAISATVSDIGLIMLIILMSGMVGFAVVFLQVPQTISTWMLDGVSEPHLIILIMLLFVLVAGCFIESTVLVLLLTPIFVPVVKAAGFDPVHFGILMMSIVTLGGMTPPVGVAMYAVCSILDVKIEEYTVAALPFLFTIIVVIALLLFVPGLVMWLPDYAFGGAG